MQPNITPKQKQPPTYPFKQNGSKKQGQNRQGLRRRLIALSIIAGVFVYWAGSLWYDQQAALQQKKVELEEAEIILYQMTEKHHHLNQQITRLHDHEYIAEIARRDYFLSKPGEMIFKIPEK